MYSLDHVDRFRTDCLAASVNAAVPRDEAVRAGRLAEGHRAGGNLNRALAAADHGVALLEQRVASNHAAERLNALDG
jgi:hypothetical protein